MKKFSKPNLTSCARLLRTRSTDTEAKLWRELRSKRFENIKFRRQAPIGKYIVDFVSHEKSLIIECDGGQHLASHKEDLERDQWLESQGYRMLRFWDNEIIKNLDAVLDKIYQVCKG